MANLAIFREPPGQLLIDGWVDEYGYYGHLISEKFNTFDDTQGWGLFLKETKEFLQQLHPEIDVDEEFETMVRDALREADHTSPLEQMKQALNVGVVYVPGAGDSGLDTNDLCIKSAFNSEVHSTDVRADNAMANFLRFANISSNAFRDAVLSKHKVDLYDLWSTMQDNPIPIVEEAYVQHASLQWQDFNIQADPSKPALITPQQAVELLDNASYGGVPVCYAYLDPKAFLDLPWDVDDTHTAVELQGVGEGKPMIGIHSFLNGSGHFVRTDVPVRLPLDHRNWHTDETRYRYGIEEVYGIYRPAFQVQPTVHMEPVPEESEENSGPRP